MKQSFKINFFKKHIKTIGERKFSNFELFFIEKMRHNKHENMKQNNNENIKQK